MKKETIILIKEILFNRILWVSREKKENFDTITVWAKFI